MAKALLALTCALTTMLLMVLLLVLVTRTVKSVPRLLPSLSAPSASTGPLTRSGTTLLLRGQPAFAAGVNCYELVLETSSKTPYDLLAPLAQASALTPDGRRVTAGVPFVRFWVSYYSGNDRLYAADKAAYFAKIDGIVSAAERLGVGLIPTLFWSPQLWAHELGGVPDWNWGDPAVRAPIVDAWTTPGSRTLETAATYVREVVERYRGSPAVWMWEFGNELNYVGMDPAKLTEMVNWFWTEVRKYDVGRPVSSGNGASDSLVAEADCASAHYYSGDADFETKLGMSRDAGIGFFLGEWGSCDSLEFAKSATRRILQSGVQLSAQWVYGGAESECDWNLATPARAEFLALTVLTNAHYAGQIDLLALL